MYTLPVLETIGDDLSQFSAADISRAVDEQALLFERAVNERGYVCMPITQSSQAIGNASVTHQ